MCSASAGGTGLGGAAEEIRRVALELFAEQGVDAVSVRGIAATAGVSPALVIHHFGSKEGLRVACDAATLSTVREAMSRLVSMATEAGAPSTSSEVLAQLATEQTRSALAYLVRAVVDGGEAGDALIDEVVSVARAGLSDPVDEAWGRGVDDVEMTAVLLTLYDLAPLLMARHVERITGSDPYTPQGFARVARAALSLYETLASDGREPAST